MNTDQMLLHINGFEQQTFPQQLILLHHQEWGQEFIAEDILLDLNQELSQMTDPNMLFFALQKRLEK